MQHFDQSSANYGLPKNEAKCVLWDDLGDRTKKELHAAREKAKAELREKGIEVDDSLGEFKATHSPCTADVTDAAFPCRRRPATAGTEARRSTIKDCACPAAWQLGRGAGPASQPVRSWPLFQPSWRPAFWAGGGPAWRPRWARPTARSCPERRRRLRSAIPRRTECPVATRLVPTRPDARRTSCCASARTRRGQEGALKTARYLLHRLVRIELEKRSFI